MQTVAELVYHVHLTFWSLSPRSRARRTTISALLLRRCELMFKGRVRSMVEEWHVQTLWTSLSCARDLLEFVAAQQSSSYHQL